MPTPHLTTALAMTAFGAILYPSLEILWRGYTHPAMALAGGVACLLLYYLNTLFFAWPRPARAAAGAALILLVEFTVGVVCNLFWGMGIWDYSGEAYNLLGQICPAFAALWLGLAYLFSLLSDRMEREREEAAQFS